MASNVDHEVVLFTKKSSNSDLFKLARTSSTQIAEKDFEADDVKLKSKFEIKIEDTHPDEQSSETSAPNEPVDNEALVLDNHGDRAEAKVEESEPPREKSPLKDFVVEANYPEKEVLIEKSSQNGTGTKEIKIFGTKGSQEISYEKPTEHQSKEPIQVFESDSDSQDGN